MDRRFSFVIVFGFTLFSTILVGIAGILTGQGWLVTILYMLVTMWIAGILSQIVTQHLFLQVIYPLEQERIETEIQKAKISPSELEGIEEIEEVVELVEGKNTSEEA